MSTFAECITAWYRTDGRDLPWRHTRDPYAIWLSEVILQQTRISQGYDYWVRFMWAWPRVEDLAAASEDEVLKMWQGLGYYSRARHLHAAARQIVEQGGFPDTFEGLRRLKGVGDYTAAAIASFAFSLPVAVVDGNVYRVLSRHYGIDTPIDTTRGKKVFAALAQSLLPPAAAAEYNQAMMDFGALLCTPQSPRCLECPLQETCVAFRTGRVGQLPVKSKTTRVTLRRLNYIYIRCNGFTALHQRGEGDIWQGLWEPYCGTAPAAGRLTLLAQDVKHVLSHQELHADFWLLETEERPQLPAGYQWVEENRIDSFAVPRLVEKMWQKVAEHL